MATAPRTTFDLLEQLADDLHAIAFDFRGKWRRGNHIQGARHA